MEESNVLVEVLLPVILLLIMFGMGMTLTPRDFANLRMYPRAVGAGLIGQLVLLPAVGFVLAGLWGLTPALAVGLIVLTACPGGTTSNVVSFLARGDVPLSVALTAFNSCIVVFTIPLYAGLAMDVYSGEAVDVPLPVARMIVQVFMFTMVPIGLGMTLRALAPAFCKRIGPAYDRFAALGFLFILLAIVWESRENILAMAAVVGGVTAVLAVIMTAIGLLLGVLLSVGTRQVITLGIEVGIQNTLLGMVVAGTVLNGVRGLDGEIMYMPAAVYGLLMFLPALGIIFYGRRRFGTALEAAG